MIPRPHGGGAVRGPDNKRVVGMITRACILKDLYREWKY